MCGSTKSVYFNKKTKKFLCNAHSRQVSRHGKIKNKNIKKSKNTFRFFDTYVEMDIYNNKGEVFAIVLIDAEDYDNIKDYKWYLTKGYVTNRKLGKLHRYLTNTPKHLVVDHINMNKLDNRKENLRVCKQQQNCFNKLEQKNNSSGHRGVTFNKRNNKWRARIGLNEKQIHLGYYDKLEDAIEARLSAENKYYKEFSPTKLKGEDVQ